MGSKKSGSVEYATVDDQYFEQRKLRPYARVFHLWALGVGAVISGDFFGWNFGLAAGGFGGLLIALIIITLMYVGLCYSIAEMSPALPHAGGAYSFARSSMGPWAGYITGLAENMEYILTPAVIVVGIGGYMGAITGSPASFAPIWWLVAYAMFVGLNIWGVELSFKFSVVITFLALGILIVFYIGAIGHFDLEQWALNIAPASAEGSRWLPYGIKGVFGALPFAIWFYLAIEELPLAAEESHDPKKDMPKGLLYGLLTLVICAFLTLFLNTGIHPGAEALAKSDEPLFEGFKAIFGDGMHTKILALIAVAGLIASFHTIIFAYGRQIFSLSRAGYFPRFLSLTHSKRQTPHVALIAGAILGYIVALLIHFLGSDHPVGAVLLNMAVFGAVLSYILQMVAFIILRRKMPNIERPFVSPLGIPGAAFALIICCVTLIGLFFSDPVYRRVVIGAAIWFALGIAYFGLYGRHHLVRAPEEDFALKMNETD
ncbi:MAG: ethanolamine permease [Myxococcota bacterium]|nr:ethanolamine permease [Myxococcota bacterium]